MDDLRRDAELLLARPDAGRPPTIRRVAAAWLAEHPADEGELVTEEWLRSVGFESDGCDPPLFCRPCRSMNGGPLCYLVYSPYMGCDGWAVGSQPFSPDTLLPDNFPTRGKVRALLAALG